MKKFAVLYTCFNRKEKTLAALTKLHEAYDYSNFDWEMEVYLTDDGSTDGTSNAVAATFPNVKILKGSGTLYWAGGMRNSWEEAYKNKYNAYLLLNDDTNVYKTLFEQIEAAETFCEENFKQKGVYVGATWDPIKNKMSYSGSIITNWFLGKFKKLAPDTKVPLSCHLGNANIMWVPDEVVSKIGTLSKGYVHGMADYDYTLQATKKKIPTLIMPDFAGECHNDHKDSYAKFVKLSFSERLKMLYSPIGLDFKSHMYFMKKHFPIRLPIFFIMGYVKILFPNFYRNKIYKARRS